MKHYEMLCVLPGTLGEAEVTPVVESVSQTLGSYDAINVTVEDMGKSKLAYPIKHIRYGYFQLFYFELDADKLAKLENSVRLIGTLLRVIIRVSDPAKTTQYTLAQDPTALSAPQKEDTRDSRNKRSERRTEKSEKESIQETTDSQEKESIRDEQKIKETKKDKDNEEVNIENKKEEKVEKKKEEVKETITEDISTKETTEKKISIEDIDQKLDELLQKDIDTI